MIDNIKRAIFWRYDILFCRHREMIAQQLMTNAISVAAFRVFVKLRIVLTDAKQTLTSSSQNVTSFLS